MKLSIYSPLPKHNFETVVAHFNEDLFDFLVPPFALKKIDYQGEQLGDTITVKLLGQLWKVEIIDRVKTNDLFYFIDKGIKLPFPLIYWTHKHQVVLKDDMLWIEDHINFEAKWSWLNYPMYLALYLGFNPRKKQYRKYFDKLLK